MSTATEQVARPGYFLDPHGAKSPDAARQILTVTRPFRTTDDRDLTVLDVGCGFGYTAVELARTCRAVVAIEPSPHLHETATSVVRESRLQNIQLRRDGIESISDSNAFDVVVLDNVLEHIPDQRGALAIVERALKPGGVLYLLVPNKLWPMEAHYALPFLSYLPVPLASRYLRLTRRGTDYTDASYAPTYGRLRKLLAGVGLQDHFVVPGDLSLTVEGPALHYRLGAALLKRLPWLWRISKGFLVVAVKPRRA